MTRHAAIGCALGMVLVAGLTACSHAPAAPPAGPIVLIVVDTLRADHVTCYGYARQTTPSICRLAGDGVTFERAYTPRTATTPAIASVFTGWYPHRHGVRHLYQVLPREMQTLAERFHDGGYKTGGFVSSFVMVRDFSGFDQGFDVYDDFVSTREASRENFERPASETVDRAVAWLRANGPHALLFVHLIEPHGPYTPPAPFAEQFALPAAGERVTDIPDYQKLPGVDFVSEYVGRYDGEIAFADHQIGRLLDTLRALGWYDSATIAVMADHGESMGEEGLWFQHGHSVHDAEAHVPLIIKFRAGAAPAPPPVRVGAPVSLVDVFPTLLTAAGLPTSADSSNAVNLSAVAARQPRTAPPPFTELPGGGLVLAVHGDACSGRWTIARNALTPDGHLSNTSAPGWPAIATPAPAAADGTDTACRAQLAAAAAPLVTDLLTFQPAVQVVDRRDIQRPGAKSEFLARRAPATPLTENEREALRRLGYGE